MAVLEEFDAIPWGVGGHEGKEGRWNMGSATARGLGSLGRSR